MRARTPPPHHPPRDTEHQQRPDHNHHGITSLLAFSDTALVELKQWLQPWWLADIPARGEKPGGITGGGGSGIQFDTMNEGGWLSVETDVKHPSGLFGQQYLADLGKILLQTYDVAGDIELDGGRSVNLTANGDSVNLVGHNDVELDTVNGDIRLNSQASIYLHPITGNIIVTLPTGDPSVTNAVWDDLGVLVMSGAVGPPLLIAEAILSAPAAVIDFNSIPQRWDALLCSAQLTVTGATVAQDQIRFNGDGGAHYHWSQVWGSGGSATGAWDGGVIQTIGRISECPPTGADTQIPVSTLLYLGGYSGVVQRKTYIAMFGEYNTHAQAGIVMGGWNQTPAITRVERVVSTGSYDTDSRYHVYGMPKFPGAA